MNNSKIATASGDSDAALLMLRISLARIAQAAGIETAELPVLGKAYEQLADLARTQNRGWNSLAAMLAEFAEEASNNYKLIGGIAKEVQTRTGTTHSVIW